MKTLRDLITLIEAGEPGTKRADPPVTGQLQQITQAPKAAPAPAPKAAPHRYVPGATWNKGVLGIGSTGPEVDKLRQQLGLAPNGGKFDNETRDAVIQRQRELGVTADGAWGPGTARADAAKPKTAPQATELDRLARPPQTTPTAPATGANDGDAGDAEARANQNRMTAPTAPANDGTAGEAEARAYQNRVPTASTGANDGTAGEAQARANQNPAPQSPNTGPVEVNINGAMYQMFLNSDGYYYIPGENVPRDQKGNNVYRPGERMPMQGPKTAPFPRGYRGPITQALPGRAVPDGGQISDTPMAESVGFANDELNRLVSLVHYR
jgi:hypothetical protein